MALTLLEYAVAVESVSPNNVALPVISFGAVPAGQLWRVDQLAVGIFFAQNLATAPAPPSVLVYDRPPGPAILPIQGTDLSRYKDFTTGAFIDFWGDWDDQGSPLTILGGNELSVVFIGATQAQLCVARAQYGLYQGTSGTPTPAAGSQPSPIIPVSI